MFVGQCPTGRVLVFSFYLLSACFLDADSTLMRRRSVPASPGAECCRPGSASQFWRARPIVRVNPAAQRGLLSCEHVLDAGANFASVAVRIRVRFRQRALASGPHMNTALEAADVQSLLDRARAIGAVAEHVRRRVALSQEFVRAPPHRSIEPQGIKSRPGRGQCSSSTPLPIMPCDSGRVWMMKLYRERCRMPSAGD